MLRDLNSINSGEERWDVCIIGAGVAGITLARKLARKKHRVIVLEAGGMEFTDASQEVYDGDIVGDYYKALKAVRIRYFGGSSNHWGGWCRQLDDFDFGPKAGFPLARWPISKAAIDPYRGEADEILQLAPQPADESAGDTGINKIYFSFSPRVSFNEKYRDEVVANPLITLVLEANVLDLEADDRRIVAARARNYQGTWRDIRADYFVLACGGIENLRLLLWMNENNNGRIIKNSKSLGRYWMDHPHYDLGQVIVTHAPTRVVQDSWWAPYYYAFFSIQDHLKHEKNLLNCGLRIKYSFRISEGDIKKPFIDLACNAPKLGKYLLYLLNKEQACVAKLVAAWEQEPREINRIALSPSRRDKFGVPRSVLHLHKTEADLRTARESALVLGKYLIKRGLGRMRLYDWVWGRGEYPTDSEICGPHHLGGTRMGDNTDISVVDSDLKVHGQANFFIAGSSVFPSGGHANPTLSIVQFALRLSDHLDTVLRRKSP